MKKRIKVSKHKNCKTLKDFMSTRRKLLIDYKYQIKISQILRKVGLA